MIGGLDFKQVHALISQIRPLNKYFRGIITDFHQSMLQGSAGFWIYYIESEPIGHYICIFEKQSGDIYIFDSFAQPPSYYGLYIESKTNEFPIQLDTSQNCGIFCLFFAFHSTYLPPSTVVDRFFQKNNYQFNEKVVKSWLVNFVA